MMFNNDGQKNCSSETSLQLGNINHAYPYYMLISFGSKRD